MHERWLQESTPKTLVLIMYYRRWSHRKSELLFCIGVCQIRIYLKLYKLIMLGLDKFINLENY